MKSQNQTIGKLGELAARKFLVKKGYKIIEQNYRNKYLEIDLITSYKKRLVFIEIKTRVRELFGMPEDALTRSKIKKLIWNAAVYAVFNKYTKGYQIDAICIVLDDNKNIKRLTHHQNITS